MSITQNMITKALCEELFSYDAETGKLYNRLSRGPSLKGREAGFENGNGYRRIGISGIQIYTHQIVWLIHHGVFPEGEIDHADGDKKNNRIANLRLTDRSGNMKNTGKRSHSKQPYKGVRAAGVGRWSARITSNKIHKHLGTFDSPELAREAYRSACEKLHGEFGRIS